MITFLEFILESSERERMRAAVEHEGMIHKGKPLETHQDIVDRKGLDPKKSKRGFWLRHHGKETGEFLTPEQAAQHMGRGKTTADTADLKNAADRMTMKGKEDPFAGSYASTDQIKSNVLAMRKHGTTISEGNPLAKVAKALENKGKRGKTSYMATISADRGGMSKSEKHEAHGRLQSTIRRHIKKGMLKMVGGPKQSGEYRYADPEPGEEGVAKEKSYVLAPGKHPKARGNFHRIMKKLGRDAGQESVLKVTQVGKKRPAGSLLYTTGPKTGTSEKVGRMHMNVDMPTGSGRTKFKNKDASIVVKENDDK
jgi:hypothetical protein